MVLKSINQRIRQAFTDAAYQYDVLTDLHKEIGRELAAKVIKIESVDSILDIGMGTGFITKKLKFYFPESLIVGLDFAEGMINKAREGETDLTIVQADAGQLPFKDNSFDVIVSNLAFQWVDDLEKAFGLCRQSLKNDGTFLMTMFGFKTFDELFVSLAESSKLKDKTLKIHRLPMQDEVAEAMRHAGFNDIKVDYERIKVRFTDMMSLIKWIKSIGANMLGRDMYIGKDLLLSANDYYNKNFKDKLGVYATFEVIWVEGKK